MIAEASTTEAALIGTLLLNPAAIDHCGDLHPLDFVDRDLGRAYDLLRMSRASGHSAGSVGGMLLLLRYAGLPESVTSAEAGRKFIAAAGTGSFAPYHAGIIARRAVAQRQREIAARWLNMLDEDDRDPSTVAEKVAEELSAIGNRHSAKVRDFADVGADVLARMRARRERPGEIGANSGLLRVDASVGGWHEGELVVLAARPGQGKTALAMQVALHNARKDRRVLFCSLEMRDTELVSRVLCGEAGVDGRRLRVGTWSEEDYADLERTRNTLGMIPISVYDPPGATIDKITSVARLENARRSISLIVVDYLQLIRAHNHGVKRHEQIGEQTSALKSLAKELECPVLCLAQLNREAEGQEPKLSHLRESGSIEQDADMVLAIQRSNDTDAELIVLKHRAGEVGKIALKWDGPATRFTDPDDAFSGFNANGFT